MFGKIKQFVKFFSTRKEFMYSVMSGSGLYRYINCIIFNPFLCSKTHYVFWEIAVHWMFEIIFCKTTLSLQTFRDILVWVFLWKQSLKQGLVHKYFIRDIISGSSGDRKSETEKKEKPTWGYLTEQLNHHG